MTGVVRPYRGVAAETRREQRRKDLIDACLDLVDESGVGAVTAEAISARAGLSKRYFYESFRDRDAILIAAIDSVLGPMGTELRQELARCGSTDERVERVARVLVRTFTADRRVAALYTSAPGNSALAARRREMIDEFTPTLVRDVLRADPDDPRALATTLLMVAGTTEVLDRWLRGDLALDEAEFIRTLTALGRRLAAP
ncbi:TetR/AcrR family transcriptional regulator [Nocardia sp. NPDC050718]|uniref:TetR/AcrR family transcriptional regulator n=1 Tax=Nocardia sp. NPDC050718 TaxID=3155788 RepID=UPI0033FFCD1F